MKTKINKNKKIIMLMLCTVIALSLSVFLWACKPKSNTDAPPANTEIKFTYPQNSDDKKLGVKTNTQTHEYDSLIVNPVFNLRSDYIMGVDASMVYEVEKNGGVYYNAEGIEQDVFKIMADSGVNFFRVRIWNDPTDKFGDPYGGGNNTAEVGVTLAKRAQDAGMNILVDFHYSDFWADPETQDTPRAWTSYTDSELITAGEAFTKNTLNKFKTAGVDVAFVQIGNEINNGLLFNAGKIKWGGENEVKSFNFISDFLKSCIKGAKDVFPSIYSAVHLANGGNFDEFNVFFGHLSSRNVNYDAIGVSYYPYYHGSLDALQNNMDKISAKYNKYVYVAETSYGYTDEYNSYTANTYNSSFEDAGKYLTGVQGQATALRDVIEATAKVPNQKGLGVFYWEPAWLPVKNAGWANTASGRVDTNGLNTWANQGLFSYSGKMLPSLNVFKFVKDISRQVTNEVATRLRSNTAKYTLNLAENETLPETFSVETNLAAIRQRPITWTFDETEVGTHTATGVVEISGVTLENRTVTIEVEIIYNYIKDPGYENQGITDEIKTPWKITENSIGERVVKLDRKTDMRSGKTDMNWYHSSKDYTFTVSQELTNLPNGTYELSVWFMGTTNHSKAEIFILYNNGDKKTYDFTDKFSGWDSYKRAVIEGVEITSPNATIGITISAPKLAWGHLDDWSMVKS